MTPDVYRVRELVVTYSPMRAHLPIQAIDRLSTPRDAAVLASALLADATVETVLALHLTTTHELIGVHVVSTGTLDTAIVHPRLCSAQHKRGYVAAVVMWGSGCIRCTASAPLLPNAT